MIKYFKYVAKGPFVQTDLEFKTKIDWDSTDESLEKYLHSCGYEICAENYEDYQSIADEEEESGVEWEANYYFQPLSKEEYDELDIDERQW